MSLIPILTSNTSGLPFVEVSATSERDINYAYKPFTSTGGNWSPIQGSVSNQWLKIKFNTKVKVNSYLIGNTSANSVFFNQLPNKWELQASNDDFNTFDILDTRDNQTWNAAEDRIFNINNTNYYSQYRIYVISNNGNASYLIIGKVALYGNIKEINNKLLLQSNNKVYSLQSKELKYETKLTSNTTPSPFVASASSQYNTTLLPFRAFNGTNSDANSWATASNSPTGHIQIDFGSQKLANIVYVTNRNNTDFETTSPKDFNILGSNDNVNFDKILEIKNQTSWIQNETRKFSITNPNRYRYYRLEILSNNGATYTAIGEILYALESGITELSLVNVKNFTNYGADIVGNINTFFVNKNYILQDTVSEDTDGLWKQELDRKPLSIKFK